MRSHTVGLLWSAWLCNSQFRNGVQSVWKGLRLKRNKKNDYVAFSNKIHPSVSQPREELKGEKGDTTATIAQVHGYGNTRSYRGAKRCRFSNWIPTSNQGAGKAQFEGKTHRKEALTYIIAVTEISGAGIPIVFLKVKNINSSTSNHRLSSGYPSHPGTPPPTSPCTLVA